MLKILLCFSLILQNTCFGVEESQQIRKQEIVRKTEPGYSGIFEALTIGINDRIITGYYENYRGELIEGGAPQFSCAFYLEGELKDDKYEIKVVYPDIDYKIEGFIEFTRFEDKPAVFMKLNEDPPGCANVEPKSFVEGVFLTANQKGTWREIRLVRKDKTFFYKNPDSRARTKTYVIKHDPVRLFEIKDGWTKVEVETRKGKKIDGWVRLEDLYPSN
ncbi:MAG: hypothetical protein RML33_01865 [Acidobacteriota bacterium]|nr:hypothetical protein [Pyrinomonadaceae bacterium]MDW8303568.1 hypothetical protein [Acidobacteriota bacterium]